MTRLPSDREKEYNASLLAFDGAAAFSQGGRKIWIES